MQTLAQLLAAKTAAEYKTQLLTALQGISYVSKTGTGTGSMAGSGVAANAYSVRVKITLAGALGTAEFQVSTDGGATYSSSVVVPSNGQYVVGATGLTVQFADGPVGQGNSFEVGDAFALELTVPTFPVTSWQPGSTPLTLVEKFSETGEEVDKVIATIAAGGFVGTAQGDWLTLAAKQVYDLDRVGSSVTVGNIVLTNTTGSGIPVSAGGVWVGTIDGRRFVNRTGGTVPAGGTLTLSFQAESPGKDYNVAAGGITTLYTALPGISVNNPNPVGGSWITTAGADQETDLELARRCVARWPALSQSGGTKAVYEAWAKTASPNVARVTSRVSIGTPGHVEMYVASAAGPADGATVTAVNSYIQPRIPFPSTFLVNTAAGVGYTVTATIYAYQGQGAAALAAAHANLDALAQSLGIGETLYLSNLIEALSTPAGVRNVVLASPGADVTHAFNEVGTMTKNLSVVEV